jgi:FAD-linked sulfhydryl oxidase
MNFVNAISSQSKSKADLMDSKHKIRSHGKEMWNTLHTFSVYLPNKLSEEETKEFSDFVKGILFFGTKFNSAWHDGTMKYIRDNPFKFDTRENSMIWICNFHNNINIKLEKDLFQCTKDKIAKRWGNYNKIVEFI